MIWITRIGFTIFDACILTPHFYSDSQQVPLKTLTTFKRLAALSEDINVIVEALDKSYSGLLEIHEDREQVRRHPERPLPERNEETRKEIIARTAYVKGFPNDLEMPQLLEYFKPYNKVSHIVIRKYLDKPTKVYKSKGSVFATFQSKDQCSAFLSQDLKYNDTELITKWQCDYYASKKTERQEKQKNKNAKNEVNLTLPKGAVLRLEGITGDVTRESIKEKIEALEGEVAFVDFHKGDTDGYVRLTAENAAKIVFEKIENGKLSLADNDVAVRVLEGEEEESFLNMCIDKMKARRQHTGGRRFNRKRRQD